jgi:hypothetical protein
MSLQSTISVEGASMPIGTLQNLSEPQVIPGVPAEGEILLSEPRQVRKVVAAIGGNAVKTEWQIKHELGTRAVICCIHANEGGLLGELLEVLSFTSTNSAAIQNANLVKILFKVAPPKGTTYFIAIYG